MSLDDLRYYMEYFINNIVWRELHNVKKPEISFEDFCQEDNVIKIDVGDDWKERGYASKEWSINVVPSLQHYKQVGLKIK